MISSRIFAVPYCLVLVEDVSGGNSPTVTNGVLVVSTGSCIAVGCQCDTEGDTEFRLGTCGEVDPGMPPIFQGHLKTPSQKIMIHSVLGDVVLEMSVPRVESTISIWVNHPTVPDRVIVGVE